MCLVSYQVWFWLVNIQDFRFTAASEKLSSHTTEVKFNMSTITLPSASDIDRIINTMEHLSTEEYQANIMNCGLSDIDDSARVYNFPTSQKLRDLKMHEILSTIETENQETPIAEFLTSLYFSRKGYSTLSIVAPNIEIANTVESMKITIFGQRHTIKRPNPYASKYYVTIPEWLSKGETAEILQQFIQRGCRILTFFNGFPPKSLRAANLVIMFDTDRLPD